MLRHIPEKKVQKWFQGPQFLWNSESTWCMYNADLEVNIDDPEVKKQVKVNMVQCNKDLLSRLLALKTDWLRLLRITLPSAILLFCPRLMKYH